MIATAREKQIYGATVEILNRSEDSTAYRLADGTGDVVMTSYSVFPGIDIIYNDVNVRSCAVDRAKVDSILEINHCREGRIECEFQDEFFYLSPGDLSISRKDDAGHASYFPLSHYHGVTIMIDLACAPNCLACLMNDVDVCPCALAKKFCDGPNCFVMREQPRVEHMFSELYSVPACIRKGYFKVKILELLLFLSSMETQPEHRPTYSRTQVELAKAACRFLSEHIENKVTISQLSDRFHVSETQIKNSFKGVYGMSIYAYIRAQKMQAAAFMLRKTNSTVLEVAGKCGYDNGSKFAKAFRDVMGMTPNEYRNEMLSANY